MQALLQPVLLRPCSLARLTGPPGCRCAPWACCRPAGLTFRHPALPVLQSGASCLALRQTAAWPSRLSRPTTRAAARACMPAAAPCLSVLPAGTAHTARSQAACRVSLGRGGLHFQLCMQFVACMGCAPPCCPAIRAWPVRLAISRASNLPYVLLLLARFLRYRTPIWPPHPPTTQLLTQACCTYGTHGRRGALCCSWHSPSPGQPARRRRLARPPPSPAWTCTQHSTTALPQAAPTAGLLCGTCGPPRQRAQQAQQAQQQLSRRRSNRRAKGPWSAAARWRPRGLPAAPLAAQCATCASKAPAASAVVHSGWSTARAEAPSGCFVTCRRQQQAAALAAAGAGRSACPWRVCCSGSPRRRCGPARWAPPLAPAPSFFASPMRKGWCTPQTRCEATRIACDPAILPRRILQSSAPAAGLQSLPSWKSCCRSRSGLHVARAGIGAASCSCGWCGSVQCLHWKPCHVLKEGFKVQCTGVMQQWQPQSPDSMPSCAQQSAHTGVLADILGRGSFWCLVVFPYLPAGSVHQPCPPSMRTEGHCVHSELARYEARQEAQHGGTTTRV